MRIDFGWQPVGEWSEPRSVTVANDGSESLRIYRATLAGAHAAEFRLTAEDFSGVEIYPGRCCTVTLRFGPQAAGARRATLLLATSDPEGVRTIGLQGSAAAVSRLHAECRPTFWQRQVTVALPVAIEANPEAGRPEVVFGRRRVTGADCDRRIIQEMDIRVPVTVDVTGACGDEEPQHRQITCMAVRRISVEIPVHVGAEVSVGEAGAACIEAGVR